MSVFVDSSAFLALLNAEDAHHLPAAACWRQLLLEGDSLLTTSYVTLEAAATAQRRLGLQAARDLLLDLLPLVTLEWVTPVLHDPAVISLVAAGRRDLSLVDCVSFQFMHRVGISQAFTFDRHFAEQGFEVVPAGP